MIQPQRASRERKAFLRIANSGKMTPARGCLQIAGFAPRARKAALFAQGVYSYGTRPEQKGPLDAAIGQKTLFGDSP